jgi:hypothetical protein
VSKPRRRYRSDLVTIHPGAHRFGPDNATLRVRTGRRGAAAKAGHDLLIEVTSWSAGLEVDEGGEPVGLEVDADPRSLRVREGTGGIQELKDEDTDEIHRTIDEEVLGGHAIGFRSTAVERAAGGDRLHVAGNLRIAGRERPVEFTLDIGPDGEISGRTTLKQTEWGIKPYSGLFGALKVADEVEMEVETAGTAG